MMNCPFCGSDQLRINTKYYERNGGTKQCQCNFCLAKGPIMKTGNDAKQAFFRVTVELGAC